MEAETAANPRRMDDTARARLAERGDTPPEMLFFLANDPVTSVRAAIAANAATPPLADQILARDAEPGVRRVLARKLASLAPLIDPDSSDRARRTTWEALRLLTEDEAVAVRAAVTELVAEQAGVPRPLILRLARDRAMPVAEPVLRGSPLLGEEDLLALIADPPCPETLGAIARRPDLPERPCDAIAGRAEEHSVAALVANATAHIPDATLLAIAGAAALHPSWGQALARRPALSEALLPAIRRLLGQDAAGPARPELSAGEGDPAALDESGFLEAVRKGARQDCARVLAAFAALPAGVVARALEGREAPVIVALCWKSGFAPRTATFAQMRLAGSKPEELLILPGGEWALSPEAMEALIQNLLVHH